MLSDEELEVASSNLGALKRTAALLSPAFFNPCARVRQAALEILAQFDVQLDEDEEAGENNDGIETAPENVFQILLSAEQTELTDSRGRLLQFRKLLYGSHRKHCPKGFIKETEEIILRVAFSQFFVQFSRLWKGIHELLVSFARRMQIDAFWGVAASCLQTVCEKCNTTSVSENATGFSWILPDMDSTRRVDFFTARIQLLEFFATIPDLAERRTRLLSPLLIEFYRNSFLSCSDKQKNRKRNETTQENEEKENENAEGNEEQNDTTTISRLKLTKTLISFLNVFAKFEDAKSVYLEPKIREIYDELLMSNNAEVQSAALACILSYKNKALTTYREYLENLLDENKFRNTLVLFKIAEDEGDAVVAETHRQPLMPVLLRLLCGKLATKAAKKAIASSLQSAILRYFGGLRPAELRLFFHLYFQSIFQLVGDEEDNFVRLDAICEQDEEFLFKFDLFKFQKSLDSLSEILRKISRVFGDAESACALRLLLCLATIVRRLLHNEHTPAYFNERIKNLRMSIGMRLSEFFTAFPSRSLSSAHFQGIIDLYLRPYILEGVSIDTSSSEPLPVLPLSGAKLISTFCKLPAYYDFLTVKIEWKGKKIQLLELLLNTMIWNAATQQARNSATSALKAMLEFSDEQRVPKVEQLEYEHVDLLPETNYGTCLLVPHLPKILLFFSHLIENERAKLDTLNILNQLSEFVPDGELATRMASALLGSLKKREKRKEDVVEKTLKTVARLVRNTGEVDRFISKLPHLLSSLEGRLCRSALADIALAIKQNHNTHQEIRPLLQLLADLETWDGTRIDEPDHATRHDAYSKLFEIWNSNEKINLTLVAAFAHAHFATLATTSDLSLRSASASNLRGLFCYVGRLGYDEQREKTYTVDNHFVPLTLRVLKNSNEIVREEGIRTLSCLASAFPTHHGLSYLLQLHNDNEDLDFFLNAAHIQKHRHQRAFHRLTSDLQDEKVKIPFNVLKKFILPIAAPYFVNSESKLSTVSDEALRLLNKAMTQAPWGAYVSCLELWLHKLHCGQEGDNTKPIVRVLVTVIDAFHFEVADNDENEELEEEAGDEEADEESTEDADKENEPTEEERRNRTTVRQRIDKVILPKLINCIDGHTGKALIHRRAQTAGTRHYADDDDIQRAPIALATVKLLMKLPETMRLHYLHGTLLKLKTLMISHSSQVRETSRNVMIKICQCLGPKYLPTVIKEMMQTMKKGYQVHVVVYSTCAIVAALADQLQVGDLDACLPELIELCIKDQFEDVAEEKEIGKISGEVVEAKANKTPQLLALLGRFVSVKTVGKLIHSLREIVDKKTNSKTIQRVGQLLEKYAHGLKANNGISSLNQAEFIRAMLTDDIEKMQSTVMKKDEQNGKNNGRRPQDCLILPPEPKRVGALVKTAMKSRVHVFVEFELHLLALLLGEKRFEKGNEEDEQIIDKFTSSILKCLTLKYDKIISNALRCIIAMLPFDLLSLKQSMKELSERFFVILSDYSTIGNAANTQSVLQLNQLLFKAFTQLIISSESKELLSKRNIALLLSYVEADILDAQKQATAFSLVKAIVKKGVKHSKIAEVMQRLSELSIQSSLKHIRAQCRETLLIYAAANPNEAEAKQQLEFFLAQLAYEYEDGRLSAAEMLHGLFERLPQSILDELALLCTVKLGAQIVNDEASKSRKFCCGALKQLVQSVSNSAKEDIVSAALDWLVSQKEGTRSVAVQVLLQLSLVEKSEFIKRLPFVLEAFENLLDSDNLLAENSEPTLVTALNSLIHMEHNCEEAIGKQPSLSQRTISLIDKLEPLAKCQDSLALRKASSAYVGHCLSLAMSLSQQQQQQSILNPKRIIDWAVWQLRHEQVDDELALQVSKNIVNVAEKADGAQLADFVTSLVRVCRYEISSLPNEALRRLSCFKIVAALLVKSSDPTRLQLLVEPFIGLLLRELNRKSVSNSDELFSTSGEVMELIRRKLGEEEYTRRVTETQKQLTAKSEERKRKMKELAVIAPNVAAEAKRKRNRKKSELKKRKIDASKPYRVAKRRRIEKFNARMDED